MPPTNFTNSVIYKIVCKDLEVKDVFVSSTQNLDNRIASHKKLAKQPQLQPLSDQLMYTTIQAKGGFDNWDCIFIEKFSCSDKHELHARERYWIEQLGANLNKVIASAATTPRATVTIALPLAATCACGSFVKNPQNNLHLKSAQHRKYLETQATPVPQAEAVAEVEAPSSIEL